MRHPWFRFLILLCVFPLAAFAQTPGDFQGSVPSGPSSAEPLRLSLDDALQKGLRYNLGLIDSQQDMRQTQGEGNVARSALLPNLNGGLLETVQQIDLDSFGFKFHLPPSAGFSFPTVIGPFNYFDLRGYLTQEVANVHDIRTYQSSRETQKAAELSAADAREMVVYVVTSAYLQVVAQSARVDTAKVQVATAEAIEQQASDRFTSGLTAKIDMTRSQVELQTQQQQLTAVQSDFAKEKIGLARLIGLSPGQELILTDTMPYAPLENLILDQAMTLASQNRPDLKAAEAQMHAAELARKAASAERYPTLGIAADYGVIGINPDSSHNTYSVTGQLKFPIWQGGRISGDIQQTDAILGQRRAQYEDMRARVEADVRNAYLDLTTAADQVRVAQSRRALAQDELTQARDRFASGVADTIEVVQAQEDVSSAEEEYIASLSAHNLAKASVARAIGQAEKITRQLLRSQ